MRPWPRPACPPPGLGRGSGGRRRRSARGQRDRLPGHSEGLGRRRRPRHAHGPGRLGIAFLVRPGTAGGRGQLLLPGHLPGEVPPDAPPHRVPGAGRQPRQRGGVRRERVLHPAPAPEAGGGVSLASRDSRAEAGDSRETGRGHARGGLHQRRDGRVPDGRERQPLLHRGERPHPGGASRHRSRHRHRPGEGADPDCRGRGLVADHPEVPAGPARPRHRVPHQRGESRRPSPPRPGGSRP